MTEIRQITKDNAYDAVAPDDFPAMMEVERYGQRSTAFDKIISATHDHFWDPLDKKYIDFSEPFDYENIMIMPEEMIPEFRLPCFQNLSEKDKVRFANETARWSLSAILHGEQGALNLSASLCHILRDPGAQEYAANQTREEARHVTAFAKYVQARWGKPLPCGQTLATLLTDIVRAPEVYKKIVGMQMLVEGLAMGAFATLYARSNDPLLVKLTQLVMTDEAFHHKFGKIWADRTIPNLSEEEQNIIEDWAAECFQTLLFNLVNPEQKQIIYGDFGLDWQQVQLEMLEAFGDEDRREQMKEGTNIFRVLIKTLLKAGIITDRTKAFYATYVDMDELKGEGDRMVGDDIAEDGIRYLQKINFGANVDALKEVTISAAE
ncbi:MAG: ferritin-like domain-containing protein [Parvibaculum sp.]|uniref:ferritin-like domain-containing protein n=1 Tax=Parvibaculum sp. TaxID=2024848 RepID=UPI001D95754E|nr:ferritin-like domain-containing protein [Parvibaculum sp.]MBX3489893.1 ferritin-like domain-containing protein [Parvibaculum sp.]MBX3494937.1 ferritin-like domain-containing protein [Parvibaculum sp.]MCW5726119.1 ferritin-like domain-containing protein [Parvibaculum sp.]